ncbi:MAG: nuclear transport factor 2 family protein [Porphyromonadaceae bacterium]|nr:nuclear transport factor 2 family protein [Porphyromonadaceae bacterium]
MKKLLFLLLLFPIIAFSQEDLKTSAEEFVRNYYKLFQESNIDLLKDKFAEDAQFILAHGQVLPLRETLQSNFEKNRDSITNYKIEVKYIIADVTAPNSAFVTTNCIESWERLGETRSQELFEIYLLERSGDSWKLKKNYFNENYPLIFAKSIEEKYQTKNSPVIAKLRWSMNHIWSLTSYEIEYFKKIGSSAAKAGTDVGKRYAKDFDKPMEFNNVVGGFVWFFQIISPYMEVLKRDETSFTAKIYAPSVDKSTDVTPEEFFIFDRNVWAEIANYLGNSFEMIVDGDYWIITMNKK